MNVALKKAMFDSGRKQYEIAESVGLTPVELSRILYGRKKPTAAERKALARALKRKVSEIFPRGGNDG